MKYISKILLVIAVLGISSCTINEITSSSDEVELLGIQAALKSGEPATKAPEKLVDYVGRSVFEEGDIIVLNTFKRTDKTIAMFSYSDLEYSCNENGGWVRDLSKGTSETSFPEPAERVYWSDPATSHTFIGYSVPSNINDSFDWRYDPEGDAYYGSIGEPLIPDEEIWFTDSLSLKKEDPVVTFDTNKQAEAGGSVAKLYFYHALSSVRVVVRIDGSNGKPGWYGSEIDGQYVVSNMVLHHQPMMYKWKKNSTRAYGLYDAADANRVQNCWGQSVNVKQTKDIHLWLPAPEGTGEEADKRFTFYGITVPQDADFFTAMGGSDLELTFDVTYPDPYHPKTQTITKPFKATIPFDEMPVYFNPGGCTTINIQLNHGGEQMTVAAEYYTWEFVDTPDRGILKKNDNFLATTNRDDVTIAGDALATEDDATWLYYDKSGKLIDIFGNDGTTREKAFTITSALQLLSFAYEVREGDGGSGRDFSGLFVKLDTDVTLQPETENGAQVHTTQWIGIGKSDKPFNGTFLGGERTIAALYGAPFFNKLGPDARVEALSFRRVYGAKEGAVMAKENNGTIVACMIDSDVQSDIASVMNVGGLVMTNKGTIAFCYHLGSTYSAATAAYVGGLAYKNEGTIYACYNAGQVYGAGTTTQYKGNIVSVNSGTVTGCYYDSTLSAATPADSAFTTGETTSNIGKEAFTNALNAYKASAYGAEYIYQPAGYPKVHMIE